MTLKKPIRLLDLYCGAGGCAVGYHRAGFTDITGVDNRPMPRYPFRFIQADALEYLAEHGHEYDVIHTSPPCQAYSVTKSLSNGLHPMLVDETRNLLIAIGKPYIIENVPGAPLRNALTLCGTMFGLRVYRHRLFESNVFMLMPPHVPHKDSTPRSGHGKSPKGFISVTGNGGAAGLAMPYLRYASSAMGIGWMNRAELSQAIPPAYTQWLGERILEAVNANPKI